MTRRQVRVAGSFFDALDQLLPPERTAAGVPSATDFLLHDLPSIIDRLAADYETVTLSVDEAPGIRVLITASMLLAEIDVYVALAADGAVELLWLEVDDPPKW